MQYKLIILVNPISGTRKKQKVMDQVKQFLQHKSIPHEFLPTVADGDYSELADKVGRENIKTIVVMGGDGTVSKVVSALRHLPVDFGIIPMGSGNGLALAAGIPTDPIKALQTILNGQAQKVDAFRINEHFSCMLSGMGFDAQVAHDFAKQSRRGLWTYVQVTLRNFFQATTYPIVLNINGVSIETQAYFICVANSNQFGNQVTIAPRAKLSDGMLDVVVVQKMSRLHVLRAILNQMLHGDVQKYIDETKKVLYLQMPELQIGNPKLAPMHVDGDPVETANNLTVKVIPSAFSLIMPVVVKYEYN